MTSEKEVQDLKLRITHLEDQNLKIRELLEDTMVKLPTDLESCPAFLCIEDSPAWEAMVRICTRSGGLKAGSLHPIRRSEFQSFKTDVIALHLKPEGD